jgi:hypothetical protein
VIPPMGESWTYFWGSPRERDRNIPTPWTEWFEPGLSYQAASFSCTAVSVGKFTALVVILRSCFG